jgi:hypothetical protein
MDNRGVRRRRELGTNRFALIAIRPADPHFDQFVRRQSTVDLGNERWRHARLTNLHDRFERVRPRL